MNACEWARERRGWMGEGEVDFKREERVRRRRAVRSGEIGDWKEEG